MSAPCVLRALGAALVCTACSLIAPSPSQVRFVVLVPAQELSGAADPAEPSALSVGVASVTLPEYLRRAALVTREAGTRLSVSDTERWAEPLDRADERVVALDLEHVLGIGRLVEYPWYPTERPDVQIDIELSRFEFDVGGRVVADARWRVERLDGSVPPIERRSTIVHESSGDAANVALALSRALADLTREIALACAEPPG